jgi:hypothetical protein
MKRRSASAAKPVREVLSNRAGPPGLLSKKRLRLEPGEADGNDALNVHFVRHATASTATLRFFGPMRRAPRRADSPG